MPTLEELNLVVGKYYLLQICMFLIGLMIYNLYKLSKKPSDLEINSINKNIKKANKIVDNTQSNYISIERLKKDNHLLLKKIQSQNIFIKHKEQEIKILKSENELLEAKIDNLVSELMKLQSYNNVKDKSKFFQESTYPFATYTNCKKSNDDEIENYKKWLKAQNCIGVDA